MYRDPSKSFYFILPNLKIKLKPIKNDPRSTLLTHKTIHIPNAWSRHRTG